MESPDDQPRPSPIAGSGPGPLRLLAPLCLATSACGAGFLTGSWWCLLSLVPAFTAYKAWTSRDAWRAHLEERGSEALSAMLAATLVVQGVVVVFLLCSGIYAGGALGARPVAGPFSALGLTWGLGWVVSAALAAGLATSRER